MMSSASRLPVARAPFMPADMTGGSGKSGDRKRSERLAAALRENLKRRKAQARGRKLDAKPAKQQDKDG